MKVLSLDTCFGSCSAAIQCSSITVAKITEPEHNKQAESLLRIVENALNNNELSYTDLDLIAITIGPGSFTGIRAGLTFAYALSTMIEKPLIGITTLEIIAHQSLQDIKEEYFYITVEAGRWRYYRQLFDRSLTTLSAITLDTSQDLSLLQEPVYGHFKQKVIIDVETLANLAISKHSVPKSHLPQAVYA